MEDKRKIIKQKLERLRNNVKSKFTPNKKITNGLTPIDIYNIVKNKKTVGSPPSVKRKISNKKRPIKAERQINSTNLRLLLDMPSYSSSPSAEWPVPSWFKFQGNADVSVIIPLYKSDGVVGDLIQSWDMNNSGLKVETIYVDDHCPNDSKNKVIEAWHNRKDLKKPIGRMFYNRQNCGFGASCNIGAWNATGKYIIFLNADTTVTQHWIKPIIRLFKPESKVGIVGNLQIKKDGIWDGTIDGAGSEWIWGNNEFFHVGRHILNGKFLVSPMLPENASSILQVSEREMVTGCCMAFEKSTFMEMGGFDLNYRIGYWEDSDICLRFREKGYKVMFQPNSKIFHKLSHSNSGGHKYMEHNKNYFANKWINSGRMDPLVKCKRKNTPKVDTVLVQRQSARGDVLIASAIAPALTKKYGCKVIFNTRCPEVLTKNPYISRVLNNKTVSERQSQIIINLDMVYECRPSTNILEAYADYAGVLTNDCEFFLETAFMEVPKKYIVIHAGKTNWAGRDWSTMKFDAIASRLIQKGETVVCVGDGGDNHVNCHLDLRGKTTMAQLAYVIKNAKLFVGIDSFPMHISQVFNTPGVAFFGSISGKTRTFRDNMESISAKVPCLGCHHRKLPPTVVTNVCENDTLDCVNKLSIEEFWQAIEKKL
jgi:ADP-heptose:LPS heptosyltransferase/GT2 family glycosyltransferase